MHGLTHQEHKAAQDYIAMVREAIKPLEVEPCGLWEVESILLPDYVDHDLSLGLVSYENDIRPSESFGLKLTWGGMPVACVCARQVHAHQDFVAEWITTYRLFGECAPMLDFPSFVYVDVPEPLKGTIGYGGGSWVHPDWRGMKLWAVTSRLGKLMAMTRFHADYYVCLMKHARTAAARETLGWPNSCHLTSGHHAGRKNWESDIDMHWMSRPEIVDMLKDHEPIRAVGRSLRKHGLIAM